MTVAIQFNNVVFPEPLAPIIPKYSPFRTSKVIPFSAFVGTPSLEYALCKSRTSNSFFVSFISHTSHFLLTLILRI